MNKRAGRTKRAQPREVQSSLAKSYRATGYKPGLREFLERYAQLPFELAPHQQAFLDELERKSPFRRREIMYPPRPRLYLNAPPPDLGEYNVEVPVVLGIPATIRKAFGVPTTKDNGDGTYSHTFKMIAMDEARHVEVDIYRMNKNGELELEANGPGLDIALKDLECANEEHKS